MRKILAPIAALLIFAAFTACNKMTPEQMAAAASSIGIQCNPEVLTEVDGKVPARLVVTFPKNYFNPEARMVVVPILICADGTEFNGGVFEYQGEKVKENGKTIAKTQTEVTENISFDYAEAMRSSRLILRGTIFYAGKTIAVPDIKVADGVSTTASLANLLGRCEPKPDGYEKVLHKTAEAQILYDVNSSSVKKSQLTGESVDDYQEAIKNIKGNSRYTITGTSIVSYASPEGGKELNDKLSGNRSSAAQKAWAVIGKGMEADELDVKSIGQDWEGFKDAVAKSHIRDKDLILRVLSMYSDPAVRESEIKNLSQIYTELKTEVFPELRRSRFITNLEFENYSDEDLEILAQQKIYMLDESGLLHLAATTEASSRKEFLYNFAYEKFGSRTALFNAAALALAEEKQTKAAVYLDRLADEDDPDVINARGVIELRARNWYKAEDLFEKAATDLSRENLGSLYLLQGNYAKAASILKDADTDKAVACIMAGEYDKAASLLKGSDAKTEYLRAVVAARKGDASAVKEHLAAAGEKDPSFKALAQTDVEFARYR